MAWGTPLDLLRQELVARAEEGCVVPASLSAAVAAVPEEAAYGPGVEALYAELSALPWDDALAHREPNALEAIRALRPAGPRSLSGRLSGDDGLDRLHGAWTGRAVGCALGKPVELIGLARDDARRPTGRRTIRRYLEARGEWPLRDFFSGESKLEGVELWCPQSQRERIAYMEPDDDIHYTLVALEVMEQAGPELDWQDIARYWLARLPIFTICTAEAQAIDLVQRFSTRPGYWRCDVGPEDTRRRWNPYRQWIGAQIRADGWGWMAAGRPELAAELAWRDASWTHERNGIYGAMMFAAIASAAFFEHDPRRLIEIGLSEIPAACRLALAVHELCGWLATEPDFEACAARVEAAYGNLHPVHTIPNALLCLVALHYGAMDSGRSISTAVMCGLDTDCNGATVGGIVGAACGYAGFERELSPRLHDEVRPAIAGFAPTTLRRLAERTLAQHARLCAARPG